MPSSWIPPSRRDSPAPYIHKYKYSLLLFLTFNSQFSTFNSQLEQVLRLEAVACKDWLTNKVDRSVTGKVAHQQTAGALQLPLNDCGVVALDYRGRAGIATAIGHAPQAGLADPAKGSVLSVAEALTNLVWAPLYGGIETGILTLLAAAGPHPVGGEAHAVHALAERSPDDVGQTL